jgi:Leucine-rich repeat (LRR) protein/GTPase SAR1 family protein
MDSRIDSDERGNDTLSVEEDSTIASPRIVTRNVANNNNNSNNGQPAPYSPPNTVTPLPVSTTNVTLPGKDHPPLVALQSHGSVTSECSSGTGGGGSNYGKSALHTPTTRGSGGVLFGKSSSIIFPTGVEPPPDGKAESSNLKRHKINLLLDQCETVRFPFKKKLMLNNLHLTAGDIPVKDLYGTSLGNSLHKLSIAGNRLSTIPPRLVTCLPVLKTLDLSQCELHQLPEKWNLPQLKRLNLSHNRLTEFPEETMLEGLLELQELNMYGNKVAEIIIPHNLKLLSKLETLNLGYNDLAYLPDDLDRLRSLKVFKIMNNFLEKVPMRVCDMDLKTIDVSSNPVIQPPIETCERGIGSMKRYYQCLRVEEQAKQRALDAVQTKAVRNSSGNSVSSPMGTLAKTSSTKASKVMDKVMGFAKPKFTMQPSIISRKNSDDNWVAEPPTNATVPVVGLPTPDRQQPQPPPALTEGRGASSGTLSSSHSLIGEEAVAPRSSSTGVLPSDSSISTGQNPLITADKGAAYKPDPMLSSAVEALESKPETLFDRHDSDVTKIQDSATHILDASGPTHSSPYSIPVIDQVTVNDTLKVIFVGMAMAGKTSMIKRLIEGEDAIIPKRDERTVGVDIYAWDPKKDHRFEHIDSRIALDDRDLEEKCGDVNVKFSVWDFAGQHVYHATHELFFSQRALYVLVWDMGATNAATLKRKNSREYDQGAFKLSYDSSDDESEEDDDFASEEEGRRADRALERDIDEKVQFWVDCIQSSVPGAAILPVASFDDMFTANSHEEAKRRCTIMKQRLLKHEERRIMGIKDRLKAYCDQNRANDEGALRLRKLLCSYTRPKLIFGSDKDNSVVRVSGTLYTGFASLTERIIDIATGRDKCKLRYPIFRGHVGARIPRMRLEVRDAVRELRDRFKVVEWGYLINNLRSRGLTSVEDISDALHFLTNIGELSYFGGVLADRRAISPADDMPGVRF